MGQPVISTGWYQEASPSFFFFYTVLDASCHKSFSWCTSLCLHAQFLTEVWLNTLCYTVPSPSCQIHMVCIWTCAVSHDWNANHMKSSMKWWFKSWTYAGLQLAQANKSGHSFQEVNAKWVFAISLTLHPQVCVDDTCIAISSKYDCMNESQGSCLLQIWVCT